MYWECIGNNKFWLATGNDKQAQIVILELTILTGINDISSVQTGLHRPTLFEQCHRIRSAQNIKY